MDSEERPNKIRKLSHDSEAQIEHSIDDAPPSHTASETRISPQSNENNSRSIPPAARTTSDPALNNDASIHASSEISPSTQQPSQLLSKSAQKKIRKRLEWEAGKEDRRLKRKEKAKEKKVRQRSQRQQEAQQRAANGEPPVQRHQRPIRLPVTFLIDCGFDDKMTEKEKISLGSQVTRAYSDNSRAKYQAHLMVSSWGGELKERFDTVLGGQYRNWRGVTFTEEDFVAAAERAKEIMSGPQGGKMDGMFSKYAMSTAHKNPKSSSTPISTNNEETPTTLPPPEIIYLTSDSPHTLTDLSPNSTYIIGGIVDKNRHKGLCYKLACDRGIKTAKLPIGEFMEMQSRFVLATNHVVEIMVRWLECGDWGESFMRVIPKRKGGRLKGQNERNGDGGEEVEEDGEDQEEPDEDAVLDAQGEQNDSSVEEDAAGTPPDEELVT